MWKSVCTAIYLPFISETLTYRPYLDWIDNRIALEWLVDYIRTSGVDERVVIIYHANCIDEPAVCNLSASEVIMPFRATAQTEVGALLECVETLSRSHVMRLPYLLPFAPRDVAHRLLEAHLSAGDDYTRAVGFPKEVSPEIYSIKALKTLQQLQLPYTAGSARAGMDALGMLGSLMSHYDREPGGEELGVRQGVFDCPAHYCIDRTAVPVSAPFESPRDVALVRQAIAGAGNMEFSNGLERLLLLKDLLIEDVEKRYQVRLGRGRSPSSTPTAGLHGRKAVRVLYVSSASAYSGAQDALYRIVAARDRQRYQGFALIRSAGLLVERLRESGIEVIDPPERDVTLPTCENLRYCCEQLRRLSPDIVHIHSSVGPAIAMACESLGTPIVLHVQNEPGEMYGELLQLASRLIAISERTRREILKHAIPPERVNTIYNGVDLEYCDPFTLDRRAVRRAFGVSDSTKLIVMTARFAPNKRHSLLLNAVRELGERFPDIQVCFVGESFDRPDLKERVLAEAGYLGLGARLKCMGFQKDIRIPVLAADVNVLCSENEPLGMCILEAMALERPVIITPSVGASELVGEAGYVVESSPHALAGAIADIFSHPIEAEQRAKKGRGIVQECANAKTTPRRRNLWVNCRSVGTEVAHS